MSELPQTQQARSVREVARRNNDTLYKEIREGRLKARKAGRRTIITDQDEKEWRDALPLMGTNARCEARLDAEDRAVVYLCDNFRPEIAAAIATTVENTLALRWEEEREQLIRRNDQGKYFQPNEDMKRAKAAFSKLTPGMSDPGGEQHLIELFSKFRTDEAWFTMQRVALYVERGMGL